MLFCILVFLKLICNEFFYLFLRNKFDNKIGVFYWNKWGVTVLGRLIVSILLQKELKLGGKFDSVRASETLLVSLFLRCWMLVLRQSSKNLQFRYGL